MEQIEQTIKELESKRQTLATRFNELGAQIEAINKQRNELITEIVKADGGLDALRQLQASGQNLPHAGLPASYSASPSDEHEQLKAAGNG